MSQVLQFFDSQQTKDQIKMKQQANDPFNLMSPKKKGPTYRKPAAASKQSPSLRDQKAKSQAYFKFASNSQGIAD